MSNTYRYPSSRQIGILVRGLKPSTEHRVSVNGVDFATYAAPGSIPAGAVERAAEVKLDGALGAPIFSDTNGTLYAVLIIPGNAVGLGESTIGVTDANVTLTNNFQSQAYGNFRVLLGENPPVPPPPPPRPPPPPPPVLCNDPTATNFGGPGECIYAPPPPQSEGPKSDFVWSGQTSEISSQTTLQFNSSVNVGLPVVAGAPVLAPTS